MAFWKNKKNGQGLDPIAGAGMAIIDDELSSTSPHAVKNSAITAALDALYPVATSDMITIGTDDAERTVRADYLHNAIQSMIDTSVGNAINASY